MEYYDFYWDRKAITGNTVRVPGTNAQGAEGFHVLKLSPEGFIRVTIDRASGETLATYITWLEAKRFTGTMFPSEIHKVTDIWVTDLANAYTFEVPPTEGAV